MESAAIETNGATLNAERPASDAAQAGVRSVKRALSLVNAIAEAGGEAALTDLSARTSLPVSTCHHLLKTLIDCGYAAQVPGKKLYVLGTRFIQLSHACVNSDLPRRAQARTPPATRRAAFYAQRTVRARKVTERSAPVT